MRVVTYSRVSTVKQGDAGASLGNQSRKFLAWCGRGGHEIARAYEESASAGTITKRRTFQRMLDELPQTKPACIVIDTADRFSRNLEDAFAVIARLREAGINIWPLDWDRDQPPDVLTYDSEDYLRLRDEIIAAQHERRRIKSRMKRSYEGRRERGATTQNNVPLGVEKRGDVLVPSADAWLVAEIDRRLLAGESHQHCWKYARSAHPGAWKRVESLRRVFLNPAYVTAGVRTQETADKLRAKLAQTAARFGEMKVRKAPSEWTGVFRCGVCEYVMHAEFQRGAEYLTCDKRGEAAFHGRVCVKADERIVGAWRAYLAKLTARSALERWALADGDTTAKIRLGLERRLATFDNKAAELKKRRDRAFDMLVDDDEALVNQAKALLRQVNADESEMAMQRSLVEAELGALQPAKRRDPEALRAVLSSLGDTYNRLDVRDRNRFNRALVAAVGGSPIVTRVGRREVAVTWPLIDAVLRPEKVRA